ncbi:MAG: hypothetical protein A2166_04230 [Omnitrophica WOR_2 bacterium RBG_13_41_10]|nr:MAG: hypothetical protein A2166_04230 [Omnitrophica WOR_2 bacterium RBG_13_41_10]
MARKKSNKNKDDFSADDLAQLEAAFGVPSSKISIFSGKLFSLIKLALGICLLPFVYAVTVSFFKESDLLEAILRQYFFGGIISFLVVYLFIFEPRLIYNKGQKIIAAVFRFFAPLVKVAPYLLPIYTIILFVAYAIYTLVNKSFEPLKYFVFLFGFTIALHLVFSAKSLRLRQGDFLKANYIFGFSFVYIINIVVLAAGFTFISANFSFINFCNNSFQAASDIFGAVFRQLFL